MLSLDFVPMRDRIAGPRRRGKPLPVAVHNRPGTTGRPPRPCDECYGVGRTSAYRQSFHCFVEVSVPVQPSDVVNVPAPRLPDVRLVPMTVTPL